MPEDGITWPWPTLEPVSWEGQADWSVNYVPGKCEQCGCSVDYQVWEGKEKVTKLGVPKLYMPYCSFNCREDHFRGQNAGDLRRGAWKERLG